MEDGSANRQAKTSISSDSDANGQDNHEEVSPEVVVDHVVIRSSETFSEVSCAGVDVISSPVLHGIVFVRSISLICFIIGRTDILGVFSEHVILDHDALAADLHVGCELRLSRGTRGVRDLEVIFIDIATFGLPLLSFSLREEHLVFAIFIVGSEVGSLATSSGRRRTVVSETRERRLLFGLLNLRHIEGIIKLFRVSLLNGLLTSGPGVFFVLLTLSLGLSSLLSVLKFFELHLLDVKHLFAERHVFFSHSSIRVIDHFVLKADGFLLNFFELSIVLVDLHVNSVDILQEEAIVLDEVEPSLHEEVHDCGAYAANNDDHPRLNDPVEHETPSNYAGVEAEAEDFKNGEAFVSQEIGDLSLEVVFLSEEGPSDIDGDEDRSHHAERDKACEHIGELLAKYGELGRCHTLRFEDLDHSHRDDVNDSGEDEDELRVSGHVNEDLLLGGSVFHLVFSDGRGVREMLSGDRPGDDRTEKDVVEHVAVQPALFATTKDQNTGDHGEASHEGEALEDPGVVQETEPDVTESHESSGSKSELGLVAVLVFIVKVPDEPSVAA